MLPSQKELLKIKISSLHEYRWKNSNKRIVAALNDVDKVLSKYGMKIKDEDLSCLSKLSCNDISYHITNSHCYIDDANKAVSVMFSALDNRRKILISDLKILVEPVAVVDFDIRHLLEEIISTTSPYEDVMAFHYMFGMPIVDYGFKPGDDRVLLRLKLIAEEFSELIESVTDIPRDYTYKWLVGAITNEDGELNSKYDGIDYVGTADALTDLLYVIYGAALELGIDIEAMFKEVQASNMSKANADGSVSIREDGKILKGDKFFPPNLEDIYFDSVGQSPFEEK